MSPLDKLLAHHPLPTWRPLAWGVGSLLTAFLVWANFAKLEEVTIASGEVVPFGKVKQVQHLEGGVIREIKVKEGDIVKEGDPLMQLELAVTAINREELQVRLDAYTLNRARLFAESQQKPLELPAEEAARIPQIAEGEKKAYEARKKEQQSTLSVMHEQLRQKELEIKELESRKNASLSNLKLLKQKFEMSASLLKEGLTAKMEHLQMERDLAALEGELAVMESSLPRLRSALNEVKEKIDEIRYKFQRDAQEQLAQAELNIARHRELLSQATGQVLRALIQSPIEGVVKNLRYFTLGGVVRPGETIMEIVPLKEKMIIETKLNPADRGYVEVGQKALVKVTTYDYARYGGLDGVVTLVAPDSTLGPDGISFFRVLVETDKAYLGKEEGKLPISPGMQALVNIHTGEKSVMEYLLKPVFKLRDEAFRER